MTRVGNLPTAHKHVLCKPDQRESPGCFHNHIRTLRDALTDTHALRHLQARGPPQTHRVWTAGSLSGGRVRIAWSRCQPQDMPKETPRRTCSRNRSGKRGVSPEPGQVPACSRDLGGLSQCRWGWLPRPLQRRGRVEGTELDALDQGQ